MLEAEDEEEAADAGARMSLRRVEATPLCAGEAALPEDEVASKEEAERSASEEEDDIFLNGGGVHHSVSSTRISRFREVTVRLRSAGNHRQTSSSFLSFSEHCGRYTR